METATDHSPLGKSSPPKPCVLLSGPMMCAVSALEPSLLCSQLGPKEKGQLFVSAVKQLQPSPLVKWRGGHDRPSLSTEVGRNEETDFYRQWSIVSGQPHRDSDAYNQRGWQQMMVLLGPPQVKMKKKNQSVLLS